MSERSEICEELKDLALALGYVWPEDDEGRWRCLKKMAGQAAYWRAEASRYGTEALREVERQKLYAHQQQRLIALSKKVANLRKALREFMNFQVAWVREHRTDR